MKFLQSVPVLPGILGKQHGDIRDVINIGRLVSKSDGPEQIAEIIKTLMKYGGDTQ